MRERERAAGPASAPLERHERERECPNKRERPGLFGHPSARRTEADERRSDGHLGFMDWQCGIGRKWKSSPSLGADLFELLEGNQGSFQTGLLKENCPF